MIPPDGAIQPSPPSSADWRTKGEQCTCLWAEFAVSVNADPAEQRKEIETLLKAGADIHETDKNGVTPLHIAVRFRSPAAVEALLNHGARVNQVCKRSGSTALHRAVTSTGAPTTAGRQEEAKQIIKLLMKFGADPSLKNKNGKTPTDYVKDDEVRRLLVKQRRTWRSSAP